MILTYAIIAQFWSEPAVKIVLVVYLELVVYTGMLNGRYSCLYQYTWLFQESTLESAEVPWW